VKLLLALLITILFLVTPSLVNAAPIYTSDKLITVDTSKQMLFAWENGLVVYKTPVSTGLYQTPTVLGSFRTYLKYPSQDMRGYSVVKGWYYLPGVPYVMYFHQGYAIHGTYWHSNFGSRMSNGCVNVPNTAAAWLYNWAPLNTRVEVF
jgi:lipoprotein-anchoring transpeptidase ErfK/SrfK